MTEREFWNEAYRVNAAYTAVPDHIIATEIRDLPPGHALDLGCGTGANALMLAQAGWTVTGIDWSEQAVFLAERAAWKARVTARFSIADAATWNGTTPFDLVLIAFALPHDGHAASVIRNARKHLRPGGTLLIVEWAPSMGTTWNLESCAMHEPEAIMEMVPELTVAHSGTRRIEAMFAADDPRATHGQWAEIAFVRAVLGEDLRAERPMDEVRGA